MSKLREPVHTWKATIDSLIVPPHTMIAPGKDIHIECATMCGEDNATGEYTIQEEMTVRDAVRRAQFAASIQHVIRRGCTKCRDQYQHGTSHAERVYLRSTHPELGPIVGLDMKGAYGMPLGSVMPETLGSTDESDLSRFRQDHADSQAQVKEFLDKAGKA